MADKEYINKVVKASDSIVYVRSIPSFTGAIIQKVKSGDVIGRSSGETVQMGSDKWIQVNINNSTVSQKYGYVVENYQGKKNVDLSDPEGGSPVAEQNAQELLNKIIANDKETYLRLLNAYKWIVYLKKKKIKIPTSLLNQIYYTYISLSNRQEKIKNTEGVSCTTGKPKDQQTAKNLADMVSSSHTIHGIGWIQLLVIIVIAIVAGGAITAAVYYATKPDYEDSKRDLKITKELEKALSGLSPEDKEKVEKELNKQIDDAYNAGKTSQKFKDIFGTGFIKTAVIIGGAFIIGREILKSKKSKNG